jgi:hypothetical protein
MRIVTGIVFGLTVMLWLVCCGGIVIDFVTFPVGCDVPFAGNFWLFAPPGFGYFVAIPFAWGLFMASKKETRQARLISGIGSAAVAAFLSLVSLWFVYMLK